MIIAHRPLVVAREPVGFALAGKLASLTAATLGLLGVLSEFW
jgi:hypothetical protein